MRTVSHLALLALVVWLSGCAAGKAVLPVDSPYRDPHTLQKGQILHLRTGRLLTETELFDFLARFPIVYVGEAHDSVDDHAVELAILKALDERSSGRVALGMEMLRRPAQAKVDDYVEGRITEKEFLRVWQEEWSNSFPYYRDLLRYARERKIPIVALNASGEVKSAVRKHGLDKVPPEIASQLPEVDADDPYYRAMVDAMMAGHPAGSQDLEAFRRVQAVWDETMAQSAADFLKSDAGKGRQLVVVAGGNHVRYGFGIPRRVFRRLPVPYAIVEPFANPRFVKVPEEKQMDVTLPAFPMPPADVVWSVDYRDLEGDRVMLGVQIADADKRGVRVVGVMPGSAAERAGVKKDDVIVAVDGVEVKEPFDLTYQVGLHKAGDEGPVVVLRDGERVELRVTYDVLKHGQ